MARPVMSREERAGFIRDTKAIEIPFFGVAEGVDRAPRTKYPSLTARQYRAFMDTYRAPGSEDSKISFGFRVVGNLLAQIPAAYVEHLRGAGEHSSMTELTTTLHASFDRVVKPIAALDRDRATRYETWLGLQGGVDPLGSTTCYRFGRWQGRLYLEPKLDNLDHIDEEIAQLDRGGEHVVGPERGCPALKFVLPELWGITIEGMARDPDYLKHDIAVLTTNSACPAAADTGY